jgi:hypothetical protein
VELFEQHGVLALEVVKGGPAETLVCDVHSPERFSGAGAMVEESVVEIEKDRSNVRSMGF